MEALQTEYTNYRSKRSGFPIAHVICMFNSSVKSMNCEIAYSESPVGWFVEYANWLAGKKRMVKWCITDSTNNPLQAFKQVFSSTHYVTSVKKPTLPFNLIIRGNE